VRENSSAFQTSACVSSSADQGHLVRTWCPDGAELGGLALWGREPFGVGQRIFKKTLWVWVRKEVMSFDCI
jgi:hypothetical protein